MLRYLTAGETHGKCLTIIVEGVPAGVKIDTEKINNMLKKRQAGYGRGGRMAIEEDKAEILSGVRNGLSLGSPVAIKIENKDWSNWEQYMSSEEIIEGKEVFCPRPGHADLGGGLKYNHRDLRNVLERASARETAARVAAGAIAEQILETFKITFLSRTKSIGSVEDKADIKDADTFKNAASSPVGFGDKESEQSAILYIDDIKKKGESCGGVVETVVLGVMPGLGSYVHYDRKLDANIAKSVMSVQAIKGVEIGIGFESAKRCGSEVHDEIAYSEKNGFYRKTNRAGGIEGGMSNGEPIIVRAAMKPIPTLYNPLKTVDINDKQITDASVERSDVCAVPACSVVVESAVAFEIAKAFLEKFGSDCILDIEKNVKNYLDRINNF